MVTTLAAQQSLSDVEIQNAIDKGRESNTKALWKAVEKHRTVKVNDYSIGGDTVGKKDIFMTDSDVIALAAVDSSRRHQTITVAAVKDWPTLGAIHVLLTAEATGMYKMNLPKWQAPAVHMTLTADGNEIQPLSEGATNRTDTTILPTQHGVVTQNGNAMTYTPLYQTAVYDVAQSKTWFSFKIPEHAKELKVTVISSDGHEKSKDFDADILK